MRLSVKSLIIGALAVAGMAAIPSQASAATITLTLVNSYVRASPFGLAFDGTNLWYNQSCCGNTLLREMTTGGVDTGLVTPTGGSGGGGALAWNGSQLAAANASNQDIFLMDKYTGLNQSVIAVNVGGLQLVDGLDFDPINNEWWHSPDVGNVYRLNSAGVQIGGALLTGLYSGVERVDIGGNTYIIVVNDGSNPRQLCVHTLAGVLIGCQNFVNDRYEDLAFDGRYLWAADYFGNKIDKFDILVDGNPIFVPEPGTVALLGLGLVGVAVSARRRAKKA